MTLVTWVVIKNDTTLLKERLSKDITIYYPTCTQKYSFGRIDGAICGAVDIQNKCDCTLILLDGISQPLNNQQFSNC